MLFISIHRILFHHLIRLQFEDISHATFFKILYRPVLKGNSAGFGKYYLCVKK